MKKLVWTTAAASGLALAGWLALRPATRPAPDPAPSVAVATMKLTLATLPRDVEAEGSVVAGAAARQILLPATGIVGQVDVTAGGAVTRGQILAEILPDPQAAAELRKAQNAVAAAKAGLAHTQALLAQHLATNADLAAASQTLGDARAQLAALAETGAGTGYALKSPVAGVITTLSATPGADIPAGTALFTLAATATPQALLGVPLDEAGGIGPGAPVSVTLLDDNRTLAATVNARAAALDAQTGLVDVMVALPTPAPIGEGVRADIEAGTLTGYPVPRDAVQNDEAGDYVFEQGTDGLAHRVNVTVLGASGNELVLKPGFAVTGPLITTGAYQLSDGMAVRAGQ
ncbi:efflux RND transporter periplasmic adaptor subunit [Acidocella sp.]|uniref:efflux RND transporter periplasmic adaptor subunit n=1 Tax=Acidocella sp. TaxID=50710 RepID=UPI0026174220|nr:efflux RND transporter periplasmic adaptor subunit [Acidocella sp.]